MKSFAGAGRFKFFEELLRRRGSDQALAVRQEHGGRVLDAVLLGKAQDSFQAGHVALLLHALRHAPVHHRIPCGGAVSRAPGIARHLQRLLRGDGQREAVDGHVVQLVGKRHKRAAHGAGGVFKDGDFALAVAMHLADSQMQRQAVKGHRVDGIQCLDRQVLLGLHIHHCTTHDAIAPAGVHIKDFALALHLPNAFGGRGYDLLGFHLALGEPLDVGLDVILGRGRVAGAGERHQRGEDGCGKEEGGVCFVVHGIHQGKSWFIQYPDAVWCFRLY